MSIIETFFLGFLQGATEFLPISSSGHLIIASHFLNLEVENYLLVLLLFHLASALSIVVVFFSDIWQLGKGCCSFSWNESKKSVLKLAISALPIFIVGVFFAKQVEFFFQGNLKLVAPMLVITAALLFASYKKKETKKEIGYLQGFLIGVFQTFAILPGLSRSGITITSAILMGCDRREATKFSFLMLLAPVLGGSFLQLLAVIGNKPITIPIPSLVVGFLTAFLAGVFFLWWLRKLVQKNQLVYFSFYCLALSGTLFLL